MSITFLVMRDGDVLDVEEFDVEDANALFDELEEHDIPVNNIELADSIYIEDGEYRSITIDTDDEAEAVAEALLEISRGLDLLHIQDHLDIASAVDQCCYTHMVVY